VDKTPSTTDPPRPRLRRLESFPVTEAGGQVVFALRDPEGFSGAILLPYAAAALVSLMDGSRTLTDIRDAFERQFGRGVALADVERLVNDLDERCFLDTERFRSRWKSEIERYLNNPVRPAAHAGGVYAAEPDALRAQLSSLFTAEKGPGLPGDAADAPANRLCGVLSPHIDLHRGGPAFAWAYKRIVEESQANLFVIFGTAHNPMRNLFSLTRKHFDTPLGTVETDRTFVSKLAKACASTPDDGDLNLFADELAHRQEHSIEFQALFLQYLLAGRRPFKIVPVLVGSFHEFIAGSTSPADSPRVAGFVSAMRKTAAAHEGRICYVSGGDLAHIGQRFGDRAFLDAPRLQAQAEDDRQLLDAACRADSGAFFEHVARQQDRHRICGLSPTYTMLEVMRPERGELLRYDQAVELDGTSCVSFASLAFYRD
jgi:AmmeMemoRadiSam system protein B